MRKPLDSGEKRCYNRWANWICCSMHQERYFALRRRCTLCILFTEGYRSGHNEAVLKTVWGQPRVSSNLTPSATKVLKNIMFLRTFYIVLKQTQNWVFATPTRRSEIFLKNASENALEILKNPPHLRAQTAVWILLFLQNNCQNYRHLPIPIQPVIKFSCYLLFSYCPLHTLYPLSPIIPLDQGGYNGG